MNVIMAFFFYIIFNYTLEQIAKPDEEIGMLGKKIKEMYTKIIYGIIYGVKVKKEWQNKFMRR